MIAAQKSARRQNQNKVEKRAVSGGVMQLGSASAAIHIAENGLVGQYPRVEKRDWRIAGQIP